MTPHFVLEALQLDFELILVDRKSNAQKSADYIALNPSGRIPTLVDDDLVLFESAAICIHLAESHPEANLIPNACVKDRAKFFQWMMYLSNTVQAELMVYFYPEKHTTEPNLTADITAVQEDRITAMFELLDNELKDREFLVGSSLTICDFYLFMLAVWADEFSKPPLSFDSLSKYLCKLAKHEAIRKVCKKENLSLLSYQ